MCFHDEILSLPAETCLKHLSAVKPQTGKNIFYLWWNFAKSYSSELCLAVFMHYVSERLARACNGKEAPSTRIVNWWPRRLFDTVHGLGVTGWDEGGLTERRCCKFALLIWLILSTRRSWGLSVLFALTVRICDMSSVKHGHNWSALKIRYTKQRIVRCASSAPWHEAHFWSKKQQNRT